jgi:ABC-2 type transport system permease protein
MAVFRETYYIYLRQLKIWVTQPAVFIPSLFFTIFLYLVFGGSFSSVTRLPGFPSEDYDAFLMAMILIQAVVFSGGDAGFAMLADMLSGYFDKQLLAPIHRSSILLGSMLMSGTRALVQALVIVLLAFALGVSFKGGIAGAIAVIALSAIFGLAWSSLGLIIVLKTKSASATQSSWVLFMPFIFLTTAFMPKELLSGWFKWAVTVNPVNYVMESIRVIVIQGWDWDTILPGLSILVAMTVGLTAVATMLYRRTTA